MAGSSNETKRLLSNQQSVDAYKDEVCIEKWRAFGLTMGLVMTFVGYTLTHAYVFPITDGPQTIDDTYINKVFGFSHTCVYIDFNPSKSVAAILLNFVTIPLMMFTYLNQARIKNMYCSGDHCLAWVNTFSQVTWRFRVVCFALFSLVFVNSPDGEYINSFDSTWAELFKSVGWRKYLVHYIPYFLWQFSLALMSVEQTWYHYCKGSVFDIPKKILLCYNWATGIVLAYYSIWILGFIFGFYFPGHTSVDETTGIVNNLWVGYFIMYLNLVLTTALPALMSWSRVYGWLETPRATTYTVTISPSKKQDEKDEEN